MLRDFNAYSTQRVRARRSREEAFLERWSWWRAGGRPFSMPQKFVFRRSIVMEYASPIGRLDCVKRGFESLLAQLVNEHQIEDLAKASQGKLPIRANRALHTSASTKPALCEENLL
jgi:hypothetical protein